MQTITEWSEDRIERLKDLWERGLSCSQIAADLGGTSRCAIIGKVRRLNLPKRIERERTDSHAPGSKPIPRRHGGARKIVKTDGYVEKPALVVVPDPILPPDHFAIDGQCKFPYGDTSKPGWIMCGHKAHKSGSPWCAAHYSICFDRVRTEKANKTAEDRNADAQQDRMMRRAGLG